MSVSIEPLKPCEIDALVELAREIWNVHYPLIIGQEQTDYMLRQRYAPEVIRAELDRDDIWWDVLKLNGSMIGFASSFPADNPGALKLDKLYVHPRYQRRGFGGSLIEHARTRAQGLRFDRLVLAVNKRNGSAIAAYRKYGFEIADSVVKEIGAGFVMDDYLMQKDVRPE